MPNTRTSHSQPSNIMGQSFIQYRYAMKKKAIAELEILPVLNEMMSHCIVEKHGADKDIWFFRDGQLSREPNYSSRERFGGFVAMERSNKKTYIELQYADETDEIEEIGCWDDMNFKAATVGNDIVTKARKAGKKWKGDFKPFTDREFFYVIKEGAKYAFLDPEWIVKNGFLASFPEWEDKNTFMVPKRLFEEELHEAGDSLKSAIESIDAKNVLLEAQTRFLSMDAKRFSGELIKAVEKEKPIKAVPDSQEGFYRVCFLLDKMNEFPENIDSWLDYIISQFRNGVGPYEMARWMFAFDFLYFRCDRKVIEQHKSDIGGILNKAITELESWEYSDGAFERDSKLSRVDETCAVLHTLNFLEDVRQDFSVNFGGVAKVEKIFEMLDNPVEIADFLNENLPKTAAR